ncbi:hypothetical protein [Xanthobacter sp. SG618]|uniref:hypothetical protein n=1 Tax=Xanthobacter sp. SG618 TaxID=2587121 RepID=UPI00145E2B03|nr:hypothetical protein [Xanthobacter sp. SG618]
MDPNTPKLEAWRQAKGLSYIELGRLLQCADVTARRIALGMRQADATTTERIVGLTGGDVSVLDLHTARLAYERASETEIRDGGSEGGTGEGVAGHGATLGGAAPAVTANDAKGFA